MAKATYKAPTQGQSLVSVVVSNCMTPLLSVKFSNLLKAYYYNNSPTIPRYSVTVVFSPETHKEFLKVIQTIEKNEKVETIIKNDSTKEEDGYFNTGDLLIKFQNKDKVPVFCVNEGQNFEDAQEIELEDELARGEKVQVVYDVLRYTKKNVPTGNQYGISFKVNKVFYFPALSNKEGKSWKK